MSTRTETYTSIAVLALAVSLAGCGLHGRPAIERKPRPATALPVPATSAAATATDAVVAPGIVEPWGEQVDLAAAESGRIARIEVREGEVVAAGQLLVVLDDAAQQRAVEVSRAELAEAEAALARVEHGATPEELRQALADVEAAAASERQSGAAATRTERLRSFGVATEDARERATAEAETQAALAQRARARLQEVKRGPRAEDRTMVRVRVEAARARLSLAEESLQRRHVAAPAGGTVLLSRFHPGEYWDASAGALMVLGDLSRLQVRLEVDEIDAREVSVGAACGLYSDGGDHLTDGVVRRLAPKMGRRALPLESPTAREDVRVREAFIEAPAASGLVPGQRVWGRVGRVVNEQLGRATFPGPHRQAS